jgi:hypothetical protein
MNYREELLNKINKLINKDWDVPTFEKEYYQFYLEKVPQDSLTTSEVNFFGLVQEKLDWTSKNPSEEEKGYGWADHETYIKWLKNNTREFLHNEEEWNRNDKNNFDWNSNQNVK